MLCSKLDCQKDFGLIIFSRRIALRGEHAATTRRETCGTHGSLSSTLEGNVAIINFRGKVAARHVLAPSPLGTCVLPSGENYIASSISGKYDFPTKITTHVSLRVTFQSSCVVIFAANQIGDPQNRISEKYSPRLDQGSGGIRRPVHTAG